MTRPPRLWFDVEDLFDFAARNARPTGIQRVCFEIYRAALADPVARGRIGFVRHAEGERGFVEADWEMLAASFRRVTDRPDTASASVFPAEHVPGQDFGHEPGYDPTQEPGRRRPGSSDRASAGADDVVRGDGTDGLHRRAWPARMLRRASGAMPARIWRPGFLFAVMQAQAGIALADTMRLTLLHRTHLAGRRVRERMRRGVAGLSHRAPASEALPSAPVAPRPLGEIARRGDVLVVLGSPWFEQEYAELAAHARGRLGLRLAVLVHDVIPVRRPEWVDRGTVRVYRNWYRTVLPLADLVLANSRATAEDVTSWCEQDNIRLSGAVRALPIGSGFGLPDAARDGSALPAALSRRLGRRPYVLFVSTIEARKNHILLFRVWRRLLEEMPAGTVPELVFAGRVGWLVDDLMDQIRNSRHLDGRLHVIQGLDDASLRALYDGCLFTVFPSFYEGWGLPVSESLSLGRPCICSGTTSLPEAGGTLARYFDPFDLDDATRVIRDVLEDGPGLAAWRDRVADTFRPVGWNETASALLAAVDEAG